MNFIEKILIAQKRKKLLKELNKKQQYYLNLTNKELQELPEQELFEAILTRIIYKINNSPLIEQGINPLNTEEKIIYETHIYEKEINNGGLAQFFTNSSKLVAPYINDNLKIIKATEHQKLFENFIIKNKIELDDLSYFNIEDYNNYQEKWQEITKKYPFEKFDEQFYSLPSIEKHLIKFTKKNISKF